MKRSVTILFSLFALCTASAQDFETATEAAANMTLGWNLGNTLDACSTDTTDMWIEKYTDCTPYDYETAWSQGETTSELFQMFKEAGFNAIRVPVTWYPHIDDNGAIDSDWLARVKEVVDYVIDLGMYCVLNVHHDTGQYNTHWLIADGTTYTNVKSKYEALWTNIATAFKDYDDHLLFEGYNEMLDSCDSWNFASFNTSSRYDATVAADAYSAINNYAQSFVDAVRATGGNNSVRNLIVSTYAAVSGYKTWNNSHLSEPVNNLVIPTDAADNHILAEVHMYPSISSSVTSAMTKVKTCFEFLKTNLVSSKEVPVIIGEWGTGDVGGDYEDMPDSVASFAGQFVALAKEYGYPTFMWNLLCTKENREVPQWSAEDVKDAMVAAYYGTSAIKSISTSETQDDIYYDLTGRRVALPSKGIYIHNGKKILIK